MSTAARLLNLLEDEIVEAVHTPLAESPFPHWQRSLRMIEILDPAIKVTPEFRKLLQWAQRSGVPGEGDLWILAEFAALAERV